MTSTRQLRDYDHAKLEPIRNMMRWLLREIGFRCLARIDGVNGLQHLPTTGAAILMMNHIAFIDSLVVMACMPRNVVPLAKREVYDYPFVGIFPRLWRVIPVDRRGFDRRAITDALAVLRAGEILLIAPEGTRHTQLHKAKEGVAYLAYRADVPIVPLAIEGTEGFPTLSPARKKQGGAVMRLGPPLRLKRLSTRPTRTQLEQMTNECMYKLAELLAPHRRGHYADLEQATKEYIA
ncbi:MAG: 1-acyl-sn-glycerol-3-phosphate acyltransferase [Anaerolineales bacterium]|nr:1-acyl-sn-glycerol-3-phosphate acyltransferase [Anaerolineales bacterium]